MDFLTSLRNDLLDRMCSLESRMSAVADRCLRLEQRVGGCRCCARRCDPPDVSPVRSVPTSAVLPASSSSNGSGEDRTPMKKVDALLDENGSPYFLQNGSVLLSSINTHSDFPQGSWLGDDGDPRRRVRVPISPQVLLNVNTLCHSPDKMALKLLDLLFDRETQANANISGSSKYGKKRLNPIFIYGILCHLVYNFKINSSDWERVKLSIDSKCRTAFRRKRKALDAMDNSSQSPALAKNGGVATSAEVRAGLDPLADDPATAKPNGACAETHSGGEIAPLADLTDTHYDLILEERPQSAAEPALLYPAMQNSILQGAESGNKPSDGVSLTSPNCLTGPSAVSALQQTSLDALCISEETSSSAAKLAVTDVSESERSLPPPPLLRADSFEFNDLLADDAPASSDVDSERPSDEGMPLDAATVNEELMAVSEYSYLEVLRVSPDTMLALQQTHRVQMQSDGTLIAMPLVSDDSGQSSVSSASLAPAAEAIFSASSTKTAIVPTNNVSQQCSVAPAVTLTAEASMASVDHSAGASPPAELSEDSTAAVDFFTGGAASQSNLDSTLMSRSLTLTKSSPDQDGTEGDAATNEVPGDIVNTVLSTNCRLIAFTAAE